MAKLHEILAVEGGLSATAQKVAQETIATFGKRAEHFTAGTKDVEYFDSADASLNTTEHKSMSDTVLGKLRYFTGSQVKWLDALLQKEATNQHAKADIEINGVVIAKEVPTIVLLRLEHYLAEARNVFAAMPTLQPGPTWEKDFTQNKDGEVYRSVYPKVTFRTKKTVKAVVLAPATDKHPAQVQAISEDVPVAKISDVEWSSMLSPAEKSDMLERFDTLHRAVKKARMRANNQEVTRAHIGRAVFDYLLRGEAFPHYEKNEEKK